MMKKWIALALTAMLALSVLTACGVSEDGKEPAGPDTATETGEDENTIEIVPGGGNEARPETPGTPDEQPGEPSDGELPGAPAPEEKPAEPAPEEPSEPSPDETPAEPELSEIIEALYAVKPSGIGSLVTLELDLTDADAVAYNTGLTDVSKLAEVCISEPMIGSQAYSLVLARVNDPADAESVARDILANIDPAKWICVCADDMAAAVSGDLVLFVMIDENFDEMNASDFTDAFLSLYGGSAVAK